MARPTSTARQELGDELRKLRAERRGADIAGELGWSESKLSRIETARTGISDPDLDRLLERYAVPHVARARLRNLARSGRERVWWAQYRGSLPDPYDEYVALEAEAVAMTEWEAQVVPGLLQTVEYARAVIEVGADILDPATADQRLRLRMERQDVLRRDVPPRLDAVMDESVLRRAIGGRGVLHRQLRVLAELSRRPSVDLRVLPFTAGAHAALTESFVIFDFPGDTRGPVVHSEGLTGGLFRMKDDDVRIYRGAFDDLRERALDAETSHRLIARSSDDAA